MKEINNRRSPSTTEIVITLQEFYTNSEGKRSEVVRPYKIKAVLSDDAVGNISVSSEKERIKRIACELLQAAHNDIMTDQVELV